MEDATQLASNFFENLTDEIYCNIPCQVISVDGNYVDVRAFINDDELDSVLYHVPVQQEETQRAYIFLGIKAGDRGTLKFFDRSTEGYLQSDYDYNSDDRQHDINDRCFQLGFLPDAEAYVYPADKEIEIGLKNKKFKLSVDNAGNLDIISDGKINLKITGDVTSEISGNMTSTVKGNMTSTVNGTTTITAPTTNQTGDINLTGTLTVIGEVISNGISLSTHTHIGNLGNPTSQPQ